jgi:DNA-binding NarL/FixJ family response regulator
MAEPVPGQTRKVLIVSSHPLFGRGLLNLLHQREAEDVTVVGMYSTGSEALASLGTAQPDLVVVDYDDEHVNGEEFLLRYLEGGYQMRLVLLSLLEGGSQAIVYERRTMAASQIDDWLKDWTDGQNPLHL